MQFVVTIYSPISHKRSQWLRIPVINDDYEVADGDGKMVSIQASICFKTFNQFLESIWYAYLVYCTGNCTLLYNVVAFLGHSD